MSEISELIRNQAETISKELEKQAEQESFLEKAQLAAAETLVESGVPPEQALSLVKSAEELQGLKSDPLVLDPVAVASMLEKSASYIEELEENVANLQAKIKSSEEMSKVAALSGSEVSSLETCGFSKDQVKIMAEAGILEKVAHIAGTPWEPGSVSGKPSAQSFDPIEQFCFGLNR